MSHAMSCISGILQVPHCMTTPHKCQGPAGNRVGPEEEVLFQTLHARMHHKPT